MWTEAQARAQKRWKAKATENLTLQLKKGLRDEIRAIADKSGLSMRAFIVDAVLEKAKREGLLDGIDVSLFE